MFCRYCGQKRSDTAKFCRRCGASTSASGRENVIQENKVKPKKKKAIPILLIAVLFVVLAMGIGAFLWLDIPGRLGGSPDDLYTEGDLSSYDSLEPDSNFCFYCPENQERLVEETNRNTKHFSEFTDIRITDFNSAMAALSEVANIIGIENPQEELLVLQEDTRMGYYVRLQQVHEGVPLNAGQIIISADENGYDQFLLSTYREIDMSVEPRVSKDEVRDAIYRYMEERYESTRVDYGEFELIVDVMRWREPVLAYRINTVGINEEGMAPRMLYVKANSGVVYYSHESMNMNTATAVTTNRQQRAIPVRGQNEYQTINAYYNNGFVELIDRQFEINGAGIIRVLVPNYGHRFDWCWAGNHSYVSWSYESDINHSAVDALANSAFVVNWFQTVLDRRLFDIWEDEDEDEDKDRKINVFVNIDGLMRTHIYLPVPVPADDYNNAFHWVTPSGKRVIGFTARLARTERPEIETAKLSEFSANLDIVGHEFMHAVVDATAVLNGNLQARS